MPCTVLSDNEVECLTPPFAEQGFGYVCLFASCVLFGTTISDNEVECLTQPFAEQGFGRVYLLPSGTTDKEEELEGEENLLLLIGGPRREGVGFMI